MSLYVHSKPNQPFIIFYCRPQFQANQGQPPVHDGNTQQGAPQLFPPAVNMMFNRPPAMQPGGILPNRPNFGNHLPPMNLPGLQVCNLKCVKMAQICMPSWPK